MTFIPDKKNGIHRYMVRPSLNAKYRAEIQRARDTYAFEDDVTGVIEVDEEPLIHVERHQGLWISAWVWVPFEGR